MDSNKTIEEKKISPTDAIARMIRSINSDKSGDFYKVAHEFAESLAHGGANRYKIQNALREKPMTMRRLDEMSSQLKKLLIQSPKESGNVFLNDQVAEFIRILLVEWNNKEVYNMHNIPVRNKILLHGPTGNGKTIIARHIANESGLPFVEVNTDSVVDSLLGHTSSNIHSILNDIQEPCVLFWDEIDGIGYKRGSSDSAASRENDRMVNSVLVNLERLNQSVIFIAATNRLDILDSAFLRRFDVKMEIPAPSAIEKLQFITQLMKYHNLPADCYTNGLSDLPSFSEIKNKVTEAGRKYLLSTLKNTTEGLT